MNSFVLLTDNTHLYGRIWGLHRPPCSFSPIPSCAWSFSARPSIGGLFASGASILILYCVVGRRGDLYLHAHAGFGRNLPRLCDGESSNSKVPCALNCMVTGGRGKGERRKRRSSHHFYRRLFHRHQCSYLVLGVVLISFLTSVFGKRDARPRVRQRSARPVRRHGGRVYLQKLENFRHSLRAPCCSYHHFLLPTGSGDLAGTLIGVMVPVGVIVTLGSSRIMYKKGWLGEIGTAQEQPQENGSGEETK